MSKTEKELSQMVIRIKKEKERFHDEMWDQLRGELQEEIEEEARKIVRDTNSWKQAIAVVSKEKFLLTFRQIAKIYRINSKSIYQNYYFGKLSLSGVKLILGWGIRKQIVIKKVVELIELIERTESINKAGDGPYKVLEFELFHAERNRVDIQSDAHEVFHLHNVQKLSETGEWTFQEIKQKNHPVQ